MVYVADITGKLPVPNVNGCANASVVNPVCTPVVPRYCVVIGVDIKGEIPTLVASIILIII